MSIPLAAARRDMLEAVPVTTDRPLFFTGAVGFFFSFRICLTYLFFQRAAETGTIVIVSLSLLLLCCTAFYVAGPDLLKRGTILKTAPIGWAIAYLVLAGSSLTWTEGPLLSAAGYYASLLADVFIVLLLLLRIPATRCIAALMKGFIWGIAIVSIIAWYIPPTEDLRLGDEEFLHPNALGFGLALGLIFCLYLMKQNKAWAWQALWLGTTLLRTLSKTSIIAVGIAIAYSLFRDKGWGKAIKIGAISTVGIVIIAFWSFFTQYFSAYSASEGPETLTGRTYIWVNAWGYAQDRLLLGYGFYSFRAVVPLFSKFEAWTAHNELLQQLFSYGIVGVAVAVSLYLSHYLQIRKGSKSDLRNTAMMLLLFALVRGLTDTETFDLSWPLWLMVLISAALREEQITSTPHTQET